MGNKQPKFPPGIELLEPSTLPPDFSIILLGSGETGKRTIYQQIMFHARSIEWNTHYSISKQIIYYNIFHVTNIFAKKVINEKGNIFDGIDMEHFFDVCKDLKMLRCDLYMTPEMSKIILQIWEKQEMKDLYWDAFTKGSSCHLFQGFYYMYQEMGRMLQDPKKYVPTITDALLCRLRTTGIKDTAFPFMEKTIKLTLAGSQRNERKKWIHVIPDHDVVIFVPSLCDFDRLCFEDEMTNRTLESMSLFDECLSSNSLIKHKFFLVFTEKDAFALKMMFKDLSEFFEDCPNYLKLPFPLSKETEKVDDEKVDDVKEKINISHLPNDILMYICTFLRPFDLCRLSFVNYSFYKCSTSDFLWRTICESKLKYSEEDVKMINHFYMKYKINHSRIISSPWKMYATQRSYGWPYFESIEFMKQKYLEIADTLGKRDKILGTFVINALDSNEVLEMFTSILQILEKNKSKNFRK